jgi:hypothetical protein
MIIIALEWYNYNIRAIMFNMWWKRCLTFNMKNNKFLNGGRGLAGRRVLFFFLYNLVGFFFMHIYHPSDILDVY